jgi:NAD dependent epimerase/dehydratase family enzyme
MKRRLIIPGGAGFLGQTSRPNGFPIWTGRLSFLSRRNEDVPGARVVKWDGATLGPWSAELNGADAVLNLAGRSVNCRYNARNRRRSWIHELSQLGCSAGDRELQCAAARLVNSSTATIYRHSEDRPNG